MFVFVALIAAQSAGNVRAKVFRSVVQSACGYQHLAGTMEDKCDQTVCVLFWKDEGCGWVWTFPSVCGCELTVHVTAENFNFNLSNKQQLIHSDWNIFKGLLQPNRQNKCWQVGKFLQTITLKLFTFLQVQYYILFCDNAVLMVW